MGRTMSAFRLGNQSVYVVRAALVPDSRDNNLYRDWAHATQTLVEGCMLQPFLTASRMSAEDNVEREFSRMQRRLWMPPGTDVLYTDRIVFNGDTYDVWGQPNRWFDFEGIEDHVEMLIVLREG